MNTPQTQQPDALLLADEYRPTMPHDVLHLWAKDTVAELRRQHAEIERLTAENEALRSAVADAVAAERMACAELMERQHTWITNVAASALIRARGTP